MFSMPCEAARSYESDHRMSTLDVYMIKRILSGKRVLQMAANGREDADIDSLSLMLKGALWNLRCKEWAVVNTAF
jgi:hypothetical protein